VNPYLNMGLAGVNFDSGCSAEQNIVAVIQRTEPTEIQSTVGCEPTSRERVTVADSQLYLAIGVPVALNAVMLGLMLTYMNSQFAGVNRRFDDMGELWRAELRRVEVVLDARLTHIEEAQPSLKRTGSEPRMAGRFRHWPAPSC